MSELLIVNASPLVFLGNAGRLQLLRDIGGGRIVVPQVVFNEVASSSYCDRASAALKEAMWVECVPPTAVPGSVAAWDLGRGESEVLALGPASREATLVMDDLAGRKCALALGLHVMGTLGVVIAAHRRGLIDDPAALVAELRQTGMWISDSVVARALLLAKA